jgi:hypothetical protein
MGGKRMIIDSYQFGRIVIGGKPYSRDLIILPDRTILHPWWRKTGHTVTLSDIQEIIAVSPDILVVGTGIPGLMKPDSAFCQELEIMGIETRVMPTGTAIKEYNTLQARHLNVAACFHLTC